MKRATGAHRPHAVRAALLRLADLPQKLSSLADQLSNCRSSLKSLFGVGAMLERIGVGTWRARPHRTAMHTAAFLTRDGGSSTWRAGAGPRSTARTRPHWRGVSCMTHDLRI
jgi:hypothetical protein